jgi:hypothetical protein
MKTTIPSRSVEDVVASDGRHPDARREKLARLEAEVADDAVKIASGLARQQRAVAFASGEPVTVQRRPTPPQRLVEIDREILWRS